MQAGDSITQWNLYLSSRPIRPSRTLFGPLGLVTSWFQVEFADDKRVCWLQGGDCGLMSVNFATDATLTIHPSRDPVGHIVVDLDGHGMGISRLHFAQ